MPRQKPRKNPKPGKLDMTTTMDTPPTPTPPSPQKGSGNWEVPEDVQHSGKLDKTITKTIPLWQRQEGAGKWTGRGDIVLEQFRSESDSPDSSVDGSESPNLNGTLGTSKSPTANDTRASSNSPNSKAVPHTPKSPNATAVTIQPIYIFTPKTSRPNLKKPTAISDEEQTDRARTSKSNSSNPTTAKRGRGRPRKKIGPLGFPSEPSSRSGSESSLQRGRGRPRKNIEPLGIPSELSSPGSESSLRIAKSTPTHQNLRTHTSKSETPSRSGSKSDLRRTMSTQKKSMSSSSHSQIPDPEEWSTVVRGPDPAPTPLRATGRTADWDEFLREGMNLNFIPSVTWFKYAPLSDLWDDLALSKVGCVVEVPNPFIRSAKPVYWYGKIICFAGYKAYVQFENLGVKTKYGGWMSFCSEIPKPFGHCDKNGIVLYPPSGIKAKRPNYLELARKNLINFETLPEDHHSQIFQIIQQYQKYPLKTLLEVMDRDAPHRMRLAEVTGIVGDRIHVTFLMTPAEKEKQEEGDPGYWFNVNSDYVHPIGFCSTVGFQLYNAILHKDFKPLPVDYFPKYPPQLVLKEGQMLEARHPHHPQQICAASITKVYKFGYFLAAFYTKYDAEPNHFGFHVTSPYIFPCGWSEDRHVPLIPPFGELAGSFDWNQYCWDKKVEPAPLHLLPQRNFNKFYPGHKLEACCCIYPTYLGPATVRKTADHLLYISFDGWARNPLANDKSDLWIDGESYDIYPIGYAELVGHEFQGQVEPPPHVDFSARYKELKEAKNVGKKSSPETSFAAED